MPSGPSLPPSTTEEMARSEARHRTRPGPWHPAPMPSGPAPLVGRGRERNEALRALTGTPGAVVLNGPAGIGKTRLAADIAEATDRHRCTVARVVGTRTATSIPLGALAHLLPPIPDGVGVSSTDTTDPSLLRHAVHGLPRLAPGAGLLVLVDDAQFLDPTSALVVQQLAVGRQVRFLMTVRSTDPVPEPISSLWANGDALRLDLDVLGEDEVEELLANTLGGPVDGASVHRIDQLSEGNALFALELVNAARRDGGLHEIDGVWRVDEAWSPAAGRGRLADLLADRVAAIDDGDREHLELLALAEALTVDDAEALVGADTIETLEDAGLVAIARRSGVDEVRIRHPLIGDLIRSTIPSRRRRRLYADLADHLPADQAETGEAMMLRALWLLESGADEPTLFARAARFARFASDAATGLRFAEAASRTAPDLEVAVLAGEMAYIQGDYDLSHRWLTAAAELATDDEELALAVINDLSTIYWGLGDQAACEQLLVDFRERFPGSRWADDLEGLLASLAVFGGRPLEGLERLAPLRRRDDLRAKVEVAFVEAGALAFLGACDRAVQAATDGYQHHQALGEQVGLGNSAIHLFSAHGALSAGGLLDEADALGATLYDGVTENPNGFAVVLATLVNGRTALARGRPVTAERWFREGAAAVRTTVAGDLLRWSLGGVALALAVTGRTEEAEAVRAEAVDIDGLARMCDIDLELAEAWIAVGRGDLESAMRVLADSAERWASAGFVTNEARALHAAVALDRAEAVADRLAVLAADTESRLIPVVARHATAVVDADVDAVVASADAYEALGCCFAAAEALAQAGRLARVERSARAATRLEHRARALAATCEGSINPLLFVEEQVEALTRREREVGLLAAGGMRSKEIAAQLNLSVRTVDNHLQRAYTKLGVSDRTGLAEAFGHDG